MVYARDAYAKTDNETFVRASVILIRLYSSTPLTLNNQEANSSNSMSLWIHDLLNFLAQKDQRTQLYSAIAKQPIIGSEERIPIELVILFKQAAESGIIVHDLRGVYKPIYT